MKAVLWWAARLCFLRTRLSEVFRKKRGGGARAPFVDAVAGYRHVGSHSIFPPSHLATPRERLLLLPLPHTQTLLNCTRLSPPRSRWGPPSCRVECEGTDQRRGRGARSSPARGAAPSQPRQRSVSSDDAETCLGDVLDAIAAGQLHASFELVEVGIQHQLDAVLSVILHRGGGVPR